MDRRQFIAAVTAGSGLLAGCVIGAPSGDETGSSGTETPDQLTTVSFASLGVPGEICSETIKADTGIPAITDPAFGRDWTDYDIEDRYRFESGSGLDAETTVIGLTRGGRARAYPLAVLWYHEVVNDEFGGPVLVTYCPICRSGMVAERTVDGRATTFAVTGLLWQAPGEFSASSAASGTAFGAGLSDGSAPLRHSGNAVLYDDATVSYWSQILARAICGPEAGTTLTIEPSSVSTWGDWRQAHPDTEVLLPPPHSGIRTANPAVGPGGA